MKKVAALLLTFEVFLFPLVASAQVVLNEFSANSDPEWVEFYNASDSADYIKDYFIDDDTDFASDTGTGTIRSLATLNTDDINFPYIDLTSVLLNNGGDSLVLFDATGTILDQFSFGAIGSGVVMGKMPDQTGNFEVVVSATKGAANSTSPSPTPTPVPTPTASPSPAPTADPTPSPTPVPTPSPSPIPTPTPTVVPSPIPSPTPAPSPTPPAAKVYPNPLFTCRVDYSPLDLFGRTYWLPKLTCIRAV